MSFLIQNWLLILTALVSGGLLLWPSLRGGAGGGVTPSEAVMLMNREKAVVIDVCEPAEYEAGHIAGARSIPLAGLAEAKNLPSNKSLPLVVVCASGMRSGRAAAALRKLGHENVQSLKGGMRAWREAGLPLQTGA
ncbi:rhodanese-like domain-containing protein [Ideonella livida]|uniref:Rhodanese-like domain-containing protein n=1 Tax=Ideonella livida TaxID=2707176 RepID=A0A7C9PKD8_9BURK|nr:rhodanese-like domain-containing protein [Ideonella livida]NDY93250.1 rhodanese-like domain-containing protein [Ideonella livida]